ncbi:MAG: hypothetical protein V4439_03205 [Patescibacteria group bacterium]
MIKINFLEIILDNKNNLKKRLSVLVKGKKKLKAGVYVGKNVKIEPNVFFDASGGNIVIGEGTKIKANSILRGPLLIGKNCVVNSFAEISHSNIGDVCKVSGEITFSVMQSYSNKQHYGSLGYSYVGSWVNIGGGTSTANMKNTYGTIVMNGIDSGEVFLGCVLEDYCKTAVNTSIFPGKVIGMSSHLYGTVVEDVPAFTSYVAPGKMYELPIEVAKKIQEKMSARRGVKFTEEEKKNFGKMFKETENDRKKVGVRKEKLSFN